MLRAAFDLGGDPDVLFLQAARTPADLVFRDELAGMAHRSRNLRLVELVEHTGDAADWAGHRGRLSRPLLQLLAPDLHARRVFCCGPAPFMAAVRAMLGELGYDMGLYREESFNFEDLAGATAEAGQPARAAQTPAAQLDYEIRFTKSNRSIRCRADQFILDAARQAGLRLASSCTKGLCGTCKSKKLEGSVTMSHQGGIRQREIDQGMVLICCSKPTSDCSFEK
jgi:ferredoxin-NADP reductase